MLPKHLISYLLSSCLLCCTIAQDAKSIRFTSSHSMFPDPARAEGHSYNGIRYTAANHYSDSSVLLYVPRNFTIKFPIQLVFWFHGWNNSIDSACVQFQLLEQFAASGRNAVFVFPQGPKNAPDSYGGKLENPENFRGLLNDIMAQLKTNGILPKMHQVTDYHISLAGHSGAYRVISKIINESPVQEVILFDAMYGGNEAYLKWIAVPGHRFINIYTKDGGTFENSLSILNKLRDSWNVPVLSIHEDVVTDAILQEQEKLFLFSSKGHNEVITHKRNWERFLKYFPKRKMD